ncbi:MAG: hypothetical protein ACRCTX_04785, partial [Afipia sp.]
RLDALFSRIIGDFIGPDGEREVSMPVRYGFEIVHALRPCLRYSKRNTALINRKFTPNQTIQILDSARTGDLSASDTTRDDCEINRNGAECFIV